MESKYKEILLLMGLDNITVEEPDRFIFFLPDEFKIAMGKLEIAKRTDSKHCFQKLKYVYLEKSLQEEKEKGNEEFTCSDREHRTSTLTSQSTIYAVCNALTFYPRLEDKEIIALKIYKP
ncbi:PREDICTED: interferon-inducible protein AIM2-like, partial [Galeopterus variegatus]|uniref:Interferon-inducible protein AIM2-like n=1 Tax=Galeopterus variegatus TaxID=482537 RepID=A0ABM0Q230_GALVR